MPMKLYTIVIVNDNIVENKRPGKSTATSPARDELCECVLGLLYALMKANVNKIL